jgi:hypothetical protein
LGVQHGERELCHPPCPSLFVAFLVGLRRLAFTFRGSHGWHRGHSRRADQAPSPPAGEGAVAGRHGLPRGMADQRGLALAGGVVPPGVRHRGRRDRRRGMGRGAARTRAGLPLLTRTLTPGG